MMNHLQRFRTGLIALANEPIQPSPPFRGRRWLATLDSSTDTAHRLGGGQEVIIQAIAWDSAQRALELIYDSHLLLQGETDGWAFDHVAFNDHEPTWLSQDQRATRLGQRRSTWGYTRASALAAKASHRRKWMYSITKYAFSLGLHSVPTVDLEPGGSLHIPLASFPRVHAIRSHAIISAYSSVEELGLEVRASQKNPSRLENGKWNPRVKEDLEERLRGAGIDLKEGILWMSRGLKTRIERKRSLPDGKSLPWTSWPIRDSVIPIVDAIAYVGWLRSRVASHTTKNETRSVSAYDVTNVQHVTRRLVLETLGAWRAKGTPGDT